MPKEMKETLRDLCIQLANTEKSSVITFLSYDESIKYKHLSNVKRLIADKKCKDLIIVLHSAGGDPHSAYQIVELLRNHCENMTIIVPVIAKSAAMLFVLASDKIIVDETAEFGPLDTQVVEIEKGGRSYKSALNPFKTLEELQRFTLETVDVTAQLILKRAYLSVEEAIKYGLDFAAKVSSPLFSQLDTEKVGEYSRALLIGKEYGERLLSRYSKWKTDTSKKEEMLEKLVKGYPSHDYIIDPKEMRHIGFDVELATSSLKTIIDRMIEYFKKDLKKTEILFVDVESLGPKTEGVRNETIKTDEREEEKQSVSFN